MINSHDFNNAVAFLLASLGVQGLPTQFFGGLFLALAFGYFAAAWKPQRDRRDMRLSLFTAVAVAILAAIAHPKILPGWPMTLVMGLSGFLSSYLVSITLAVLSKVMSRTDLLADRLIKRILGRKDD